jgi:hypothetical protein
MVLQFIEYACFEPANLAELWEIKSSEKGDLPEKSFLLKINMLE